MLAPLRFLNLMVLTIDNNTIKHSSMCILTHHLLVLAVTNAVINNTCFGGSIGSISLGAYGGSSPYTYSVRLQY